MNKNERLLLFTGALWSMGAGMLGPLFAVFSQKIGGNILDISWVWAVYLIFSGVVNIVVGNLMDTRFKKRDILVLGYALSSIFSFGYLFVYNQLTLMIVQSGIGMSTALLNPSWYALYSENENQRHDGYLWGLANGVTYIVTGIAIVIGGLIASYFSFKALFLTMSLIEAMATVWLVRGLKR